MKDYEKRVVEEKRELDSRTEKLLQFRRSSQFNSLSHNESSLLNRQYDVMRELSGILGERIALFTPQS